MAGGGEVLGEPCAPESYAAATRKGGGAISASGVEGEVTGEWWPALGYVRSHPHMKVPRSWTSPFYRLCRQKRVTQTVPGTATAGTVTIEVAAAGGMGCVSGLFLVERASEGVFLVEHLLWKFLLDGVLGGSWGLGSSPPRYVSVVVCYVDMGQVGDITGCVIYL